MIDVVDLTRDTLRTRAGRPAPRPRVRVSRDLHDRLVAEAGRRGISVEEMLERVLGEALAAGEA